MVNWTASQFKHQKNMQEDSSGHRHLSGSTIILEHIFICSFSIYMCLSSSHLYVDYWSLICFRLFINHIRYWIKAAMIPSLPPSHSVATGPGPWSNMGWKRDQLAGKILGAVTDFHKTLSCYQFSSQHITLTSQVNIIRRHWVNSFAAFTPWPKRFLPIVTWGRRRGF